MSMEEVNKSLLMSALGSQSRQHVLGETDARPVASHTDHISPSPARERADSMADDRSQVARAAQSVADSDMGDIEKEHGRSSHAMDIDAVDHVPRDDDALEDRTSLPHTRPPSTRSEYHVPYPHCGSPPTVVWPANAHPVPSRPSSWSERGMPSLPPPRSPMSRPRSPPGPPPGWRESPRSDFIFADTWRGFSADRSEEEEKAHKSEWIEPAPDKSDNAEIWRTYVEKADEYDKDLIQRWNDGIDVFLLFTGLFSAILSAFLIASWSTLQPDNTQATVDGLVAVSQQLVLLSSGVHMDSSTAYLPTPFVASWWAVTVNGLWFTSLFISLLAAIVAMLVKEWLSAYKENVAVIPVERVKQRQFRYDGLQKWMLPSIVSFLPLSIHLAVFLFFLGLVFFAWPISIALFCLMTIFLLAGVLLYFASAIAPLKYPDCPYKSPLFGTLQLVEQYLRACRFEHYLRACCQRTRRIHLVRPRTLDEEFGESIEFGGPIEAVSPSTPGSLETGSIQTNSMLLQAKAVTWLATSPNPAIQELALHFLSWWRMTQSSWTVVRQDIEEAAAHFLETRLLSSGRDHDVASEELLEKLALVSVLPASLYNQSLNDGIVNPRVVDILDDMNRRAVGSFRHEILINSVRTNMHRNYEPNEEIGERWGMRLTELVWRWPWMAHTTRLVDVSLCVRLEKCLACLHSGQGNFRPIFHALGQWTYYYGLDGKAPPAFNILYICILGHLLEVQFLPCCSSDGEWECRYPTDLPLIQACVIEILERLLSEKAVLPACWSSDPRLRHLVRQLVMKYISQNPSLLSQQDAGKVIAELDGWTGTGETTDGRAASDLLVALWERQPSVTLESVLPSLRYWIKTKDKPRRFRGVIERCAADMGGARWTEEDGPFVTFVTSGYMKQMLISIQDSTSCLWPVAIRIAWEAVQRVERSRYPPKKFPVFSAGLATSGWVERMSTDGMAYVLSQSARDNASETSREGGPVWHRLGEQLENVGLHLARSASTLARRTQASELLKKYGGRFATVSVDGDSFPPDEPDEVAECEKEDVPNVPPVSVPPVLSSPYIDNEEDE